jgi:hypothetical protein
VDPFSDRWNPVGDLHRWLALLFPSEVPAADRELRNGSIEGRERKLVPEVDGEAGLLSSVKPSLP